MKAIAGSRVANGDLDTVPVESTACRLSVLNDRGRDAKQTYRAGIGLPEDGGHPPINYHAYAACLGGNFLCRWEEVPLAEPVLLLLRKNLRPMVKLVRKLCEKGAKVWISFKEAGLHQVHNCLRERRQWEALVELAGLARGALSSTPDLVPFYEAAGFATVKFFPTPYPIGERGWDFRQSDEARKGIFLGTREFNVPSRYHLLALRLAITAGRQMGRQVTWIDDGSCPSWLRRELRSQQHLQNAVRGPLPYPEYLSLLARHEVVFQLDQSAVPGQVAGDCTLAGVLCIGGNGAIERVAFSETCGYGRDVHELALLLRTALHNQEQRSRWEESALMRARHLLSFPAMAPRLRNFLAGE